MRLVHSRAIPVLLLATTFVALAALAPALRAATVAPAPASVLRTVTVPDATARTTGPTTRQVRLPIRADLVAASWLGTTSAELELRARGADQRWSRWVELETDGEGPDPASREARASNNPRGARQLAAPIWVGDARELQVRIPRGAKLRDLRISAVNSSGTATARDRAVLRLRTSAARVLGAAQPSAAEAMVFAPRMKTRAAWSASAPRWTPDIADAALGVVVHHTATTNSYACSQVPAIMRSIQRSHMGGNGWNDIGYNYLIDRCGVIWEGRAGGLTKAVIGAHASGFNTSTVGVSLIGTFASVRPTAAARAALQRLIAWRMDVAHIAPTGKMALTARTSDKFALGSRVVARAVSGHRDLFPSACPGAVTYRDLNAFARAAWPLGGIKVANVTRGFVLADPASGAVGSVTMRAVANQRDGQLRIRLQRRSDGAVLHDVSLVGNVIATTWRPNEGAAPIPVWDLRMRIDATSATGQVARPVDESLGYWSAAPGFEVTTPPAASVHPGGVDTSNDQLRLSYTLQQPARVGAWFYDPAAGTWVATSVSSAQQDPTGGAPRELVISVPDELPDGNWELRVGNEDDRAPARSMRRYAVTVAREA